VSDGGVPVQSTTVTLVIHLVDTPWTEPVIQSGMSRDHALAPPAVGSSSGTVTEVLRRQYRLILVILAVVTVSLTLLLLLAIVCVKYRQVTMSL